MIMSTIDIKFQEHKAREILRHYATAFEAKWLLAFMPGSREADEELEFLDLDFADWIGEESFSHTSPKVIGLYEQTYSRQGEGLGFDYFIKGAVSVANLCPDPDLLRDFFLGQLELMTEVSEYPMIVERFLEDYVDILEAILMGEERTTWKQLLAFNSGVYWMMGMVRPASMYPNFQEHIRKFMLDRAKLGIVDGI